MSYRVPAISPDAVVRSFRRQEPWRSVVHVLLLGALLAFAALRGGGPLVTHVFRCERVAVDEFRCELTTRWMYAIRSRLAWSGDEITRVETFVDKTRSGDTELTLVARDEPYMLARDNCWFSGSCRELVDAAQQFERFRSDREQREMVWSHSTTSAPARYALLALLALSLAATGWTFWSTQLTVDPRAGVVTTRRRRWPLRSRREQRSLRDFARVAIVRCRGTRPTARVWSVQLEFADHAPLDLDLQYTSRARLDAAVAELTAVLAAAREPARG